MSKKQKLQIGVNPNLIPGHSAFYMWKNGPCERDTTNITFSEDGQVVETILTGIGLQLKPFLVIDNNYAPQLKKLVNALITSINKEKSNAKTERKKMG